MLQKILKAVFEIGPLVFAAGFLWPLFAQILERLDWSPLGLDPLWAGGIVALGLGVFAQWRGSWLWAK